MERIGRRNAASPIRGIHADMQYAYIVMEKVPSDVKIRHNERSNTRPILLVAGNSHRKNTCLSEKEVWLWTSLFVEGS